MCFINALNSEFAKGMTYVTLTEEYTYEEFVDFADRIMVLEDLKKAEELDQKLEEDKKERQRKASEGAYSNKF